MEERMYTVIKATSYIIIALGIVHVALAFPIQANEDSLWFLGSGFAVIFAGFLNYIAINNKVTMISHMIAALVNIICCGLFIFALSVLGDAMQYIGIIIFGITAIAFMALLIKK